MKRLLFIALLFVAFDSFSQPLNYTRIANRYRWISGMFDSALYVPRYNGTPSGVRVGENSAIDGAIAIDTANGRAYMYTGGAWVRLANYAEIPAAYTAGDGLLLTASDFKVLTKRSITIDNDSVMLVNDSTASPVSYFYGTNVAGRKGWYAQSGLRPYTFINGLTESGGTVKLGGALVDATTTIDADGKNLTISDGAGINISGSTDSKFEVVQSGTTNKLEIGEGSVSINSQYSVTSRQSDITIVPDSVILRPSVGNLKIDSLNYTLSTTGKKILIRDTATGLVQNIDPSLLGAAPAGNYGNVQLNRNGAFATPASDSVDYENSTGLTVKNNVTVEGTGKYFYGRWRARVDSTTSSATPTINTDNVDIYKLTAQAADITSMTTNLSGTPQDGDILELVITGTAARAITWGASFVSTTVTLPITTVTTATLTVILQYYKSSSYGNNKWHCVNSY